VSSSERMTGSNSQLWLWARSAKLMIIRYYPLLGREEKQPKADPDSRYRLSSSLLS
jgi:hypothetical protein